MAIEPARPRRLAWQSAKILAVTAETPRVKRFRFQVEWPAGFRAGQHVDVRLTAPDGYVAERSYSIASSPAQSGSIDLMIERLDGGEVSGFFHEVAAAGDEIELRGPIGAPFTWSPGDGGPVLLVAGGSGVVPLLSMARHRQAAGSDVPMVLLYSARTRAEVIAEAELRAMASSGSDFAFLLNLSREVPGGDLFSAGRMTAERIGEALRALASSPARVFVCGSNGFVSAATDLLLDAGLPAAAIRTERFGG